MNVLIEIGHPAHVHFFLHAIKQLPDLGHSVTVVTRNKDITNALLDKEGIDYECFSRPASGLAGLMRELTYRWVKTSGILKEKSIDLAVSISGITTSLPSRLHRVKNLVFTDTEDATLSNRIAFPFADRILTPEFFLKDLGRKQERYPGLHEMVYLQDFDFEKAATTRNNLGLFGKYFFLRVVANDALHDRSIQGLRHENLRSLIEELKPHGEILLSAEGSLPSDLNRYRLQLPIEKVHAVLAGAEAFIGESPTMAVESSLLGTPSFLITARAPKLGNMVGLESHHRLLRCFSRWDDFRGYRTVREETKIEWDKRAAGFRNRVPPMRAFILNKIVEALS